MPDRLRTSADGISSAERQLLGLLELWRARSRDGDGYGPGNVVNLLRLLRNDVRGLDFSGLKIRQAYLQGVEAQDVSLAGAHLAEIVLGDSFSYPTALALSSDGAYLAAVSLPLGNCACGGRLTARLCCQSRRTPVRSGL